MVKKSVESEETGRAHLTRTIAGSISLKERQRQEREHLILQAAEDLFIEKGYYEVALEEIAARVGIAKSTLYLHFSCKEALVLALFTRDIQRVVEGVDRVNASETTARAKLEAILKCMLGELYNKQSQLLSMLSRDIEVKRAFLEKNRQVHELWEKLSERVATILEEGKNAGEIEPSLPTNVLLATFFGLFAARMTERLMSGDETEPEAFAACIGRIYFDGITVKM